MDHDRLQRRREAGNLRRPVGEQRGWHDQQRWSRHVRLLLLEDQKQRQDLDRLAESHVVGEAGAQPQARQQLKPAHAGLLIGPQRRLQRPAGIGVQCAARTAKRRQRLGQPWTGDGLAPVGVGSAGSLVLGDRRSRHQAHGLAERKALGGGPPLDRLEAIERAAQPLAVDLDPSAADEGKPVGFGEQLPDLRGRQRLALERHLDAEVEQRVEAELARRLAADRRRDLRVRRPAHAPRRRHAHDHAGRLERRHILEELQGLLRAPAQRVIDRAGNDHVLQPGNALGGPLNRRQQRQQALAILRAGILLQGPAERQVLRPRLRRQPWRVGREEREGRLGVLPVLGKIEIDSADQVPGRMARLQEILHRHAEPLPARHRTPDRSRATGRQGPASSDTPLRSSAAHRPQDDRARRPVEKARLVCGVRRRARAMRTTR